MDDRLLKAGDMMVEQLRRYVHRSYEMVSVYKCLSCGRFEDNPRGPHAPECPVDIWNSLRREQK